ncbi:MAG: hypothetical protein ACK4GQ_06290, partial [Candidatus Hadarchaeales archaeon]
KKRELEKRRKELEVELAWAKYWRQEEEAASILSRLQAVKGELQDVQKELAEESSKMDEAEKNIEKMEFDIDSLYQRLIQQEKLLTEKETQLRVSEVFLKSFGQAPKKMERDLARLKMEMKEAKEKVDEMGKAIVDTKKQLGKKREEYVQARVDCAILGFRQELLEREIAEVTRELSRAKRAAEELELEASKAGRKIKTGRKIQDISDELKVVNVQLASLADVSPDVEKMYLSYQCTVKELEEKARIAEANRKRALKELELRREMWLREITKVIEETRQDYERILARIGGRGMIRLVNPEDIEEAGIELSVGFRGNEPQILDMYVQSGGERTAAIMCFLLALQRRIKSPLRSIDEFEAHLD